MNRFLKLVFFLIIITFFVKLSVVFVQASLNGDLNNDHQVNILDLRLFVANITNIFDYNLIVGNFGKTENPQTLNKKVMLLIFNPVIESHNNQRLINLLGWNNPDILTQNYINDVKEISHDFVNYQVSQRLEVDDISQLADGFKYTDETYLACWNDHSKCHDRGLSWLVDYYKILDQYGVCNKLNNGEIDELWMFGGPWFGYWEVTMAGPGAYYTNSSPLTNTACQKKMLIFGFSYERGVSEMLEDLGHGIEGTMAHIYGEEPRWSHSTNTPWGKFVAGCGWMHYAPNSVQDYDWDNQRTVTSTCDDWLNYPNLTETTKQINCSIWNCDGYQYKKWWLNHLPHVTGSTNGKFNNWWKYAVNLNDTQ